MAIWKIDWDLPRGIHAFQTDRLDGCSSAPYDAFNLALHVGDNAESVKENRSQLMQKLPGAQTITWLEQTHSVRVNDADGCLDSHRLPFVTTTLQADATVTRQAGHICCIMTADCLPILLCDQSGEQVAAVHAGWRGLAAGILQNTLACFQNASHVTAYISATISSHYFEVGEDVRSAFQPHHHGFFKAAASTQGAEGEAKWLCDLASISAQILTDLGVNRVIQSNQCTYADQRFYSYRRDGVTGRQATLIYKSI